MGHFKLFVLKGALKNFFKNEKGALDGVIKLKSALGKSGGEAVTQIQRPSATTLSTVPYQDRATVWKGALSLSLCCFSARPHLFTLFYISPCI